MRISDWSSDVCSSDLPGGAVLAGERPAYPLSGRIIMDRGEAVVRSARALLGVPFRLHGRSADMGVDCVGLVALAAWRAGHEGEAPDRYGLRGGRVEQFENWLAAAGLRRVSRMVPGDIVLVQAGVRQFHVMVFTGEGFIHAHAGLRRVEIGRAHV